VATAYDVLRRTPLTYTGVRQIAMPPGARAISTLSHVHYEDAFRVEVGPGADRTAEQWARAILEDAPIIMRSALPWGWFALGLELGSARSERLVLGWDVRRSTSDLALLGASSRLGLQAQLLFKRQQRTLLFATLVQQDNHIARAVWAAVAPVHRQVVRYLLEQAAGKGAGANDRP
jgi:hypothetical protein